MSSYNEEFYDLLKDNHAPRTIMIRSMVCIKAYSRIILNLLGHTVIYFSFTSRKILEMGEGIHPPAEPSKGKLEMVYFV